MVYKIGDYIKGKYSSYIYHIVELNSYPSLSYVCEIFSTALQCDPVASNNNGYHFTCLAEHALPLSDRELIKVKLLGELWHEI